MDDQVDEILRRARTIAIVGLSPDPQRPSHIVAHYLQRHGYRVIPVNPRVTELLGQRSYPSLRAVSDSVDVVAIFRRAEQVPSIVEDAIARGAMAVWMQEGIEHPGAAARAHQAGLYVVMDRCTKKEHERRQLAFSHDAEPPAAARSEAR